MDLASLNGIISGIGLIVSAIILGGEVNNFLNVPGAMIVMGGTMAATLLTFQFTFPQTGLYPDRRCRR